MTGGQRDGYQRDGQEAERGCGEEPPPLGDELALLFLEGAQLVRVMDRVADVPQCPEQGFRGYDLWIVFDERLLVGQADRDLVDAFVPSERLLDGAGAQRAVQPADARADAGAARSR